MSLRKIIALFVLGFLFSSVSAQEVSVQNLKSEGSSAYNAKNYKLALSKFEEAIKLSEKEGTRDLVAVNKAAKSAYKAKAYDKALKFYDELEKVDAQKCAAYAGKADVYKKQDNDAKEIEYLKLRVDNCPKKKGAYEQKLAKAYLIAGNADYVKGAKKQAEAVKNPTTDPKYKAGMDAANKDFAVALPNLEAAYAIKIKSKNHQKQLLTILSTVYENLQMKDKAAKVKGELAAMGK